MTWMEFTSDLVGSLAWPAVAIVLVVMLKKPIADALRDRAVDFLEVGPAGFKLSLVDRVLRDASAAIELPTEREAAVPDVARADREELGRLAEISPNAAVMDAFSRVERALSEVVETDGDQRFRSARQLARMAAEQKWLSPEVARAVDDLSQVRNAVAHGAGEVTREQAESFIDLACALLISLRGNPPPR